MKLRWKIALLVSSGIAISYLDRQTLPVAIKAIQAEIPITNEQFSFLQSAFLVSYALMYAGGGKLVDRLGTRKGFLVVMLGWSLACASHGFALTFGMLVVSRFLLGLGEGGGFPAATRAVSEWFPAAERSVAMGVINAGTAVGSLVAPPIIAGVISLSNWRWVFFVTGAVGVIWAFFWRLSYFPPEQHPALSAGERVELAPLLQSSATMEPQTRWLDLLRLREVWGLVGAKFLSDAGWFFYLFWLPKYLYDARHFNIKDVAMFAWIPYAAAGLGCMCGGGISSWLVRQNRSLNFARKSAMGGIVAVMPCIALVPHVPINWAIAIFSVGYFGHQFWSTLVMTLPTDIFPRRTVGAVAGLIGFGGAMGGVVFGQVVGYLLDHGFTYTHVFIIAATFHVISFGILCASIPQIQRLNPQSEGT